MSCEHCLNAVTSELTGLAGVSAVSVGLVPDGASLITVTSSGPASALVITGPSQLDRQIAARGEPAPVIDL